LFPEVFGLLALVTVVLHGIKMFSDIGISTSVVRDDRGDEIGYLNTAWTLQTIRGLLIWIVSCLLAYPASVIYSSAELLLLIPFIGFSAVIQGFNSPKILSYRRHLRVKQLVSWELATQVVTVVISVLLAWEYGSVWSVAFGGVIGALFGCALSYFIAGGKLPKFTMDRDAILSIWSFGRWIFLSTALTFVIQQGDVLILGAFLTKQDLGMFAIAVIWSRAVLQLLLKINDQVMVPLYSQVIREDKNAIKGKIKIARTHLLLATLPMACLMIVGGQILIELLYDSRYHSAGWMLQILSVGTIGSIISASAGAALLSLGDSFNFMLFQIARALLLIVCMLLGGYYFGVVGLISGVAVSKILSYPFLAVILSRHKIWLPGLDMTAYLATSIAVIFGLWITNGL
jgi:O-antigen/teichoic acid export membrane protein